MSYVRDGDIHDSYDLFLVFALKYRGVPRVKMALRIANDEEATVWHKQWRSKPTSPSDLVLCSLLSGPRIWVAD